MRRFSQLFKELDATTRTSEKLAALERYFAQAEPVDAAWAVWFLSGHRPAQPVPVKRLRLWAAELAELPEWLFAECYEAVGDLAETIALLLPPPQESEDRPFSWWITQVLLKLRNAGESEQKLMLKHAWRSLGTTERFVWNKLITGGFRVGVSQQLIVRAISQVTGIAVPILSHRLMGNWQPTAENYRALIEPEGQELNISQPYPFCLAYPLEDEIQTLGATSDWQVEWKWDGIRAQVIHRQVMGFDGGEVFIWSRGEELITEAFPELIPEIEQLPLGTVLDGEILIIKEGQLQPFSQLQRRIGRKTVGKKLQQDVPAGMMIFDLLEHKGQDLRNEPLVRRRELLEKLFEGLPLTRLQLAPLIHESSWEEMANVRATSRERGVEGLMLKRKSSTYQAGRVRGDWWKWKIEPMTIDAVLVYAQRGHGRRASLYSDYTFAVWEGNVLVPFAKAYSGLTDDEMREVDKFVREHAIEKFGPVCSVKAELVFEIGFESLQESPRHKSGIAVRFPRMLRWRKDKTPLQADRMEEIRQMLRSMNLRADPQREDSSTLVARRKLKAPQSIRAESQLLLFGDDFDLMDDDPPEA
ncbi:ATP dependent DNA ligase [Planctopirus limnophila DSM 3776]|uniref:DNA ligase (ATP) n=1 Tax=Planctopirus limnophila (strain ATCC 43296 / DSM 3776 / IFAM 1008 / Mu 290) TaxID=521674 RepID=D5SSZ9_PLAL2|nr:ATP-dependent DNA ligase [Planctopirus limnophila]ADG68950.1 ATP dependent DNA ligase [Planctopirus limnophila DSM 3776]